MSAFVRLGFDNNRCGLHRAAHPDKVFAQQIARDFGRRTLKERWRKHTVHDRWIALLMTISPVQETLAQVGRGIQPTFSKSSQMRLSTRKRARSVKFGKRCRP